MPNLQLTLSNQLSKGATKTALTMNELITTMKSAGMSNVAIRQTLLNDLNTGGQLFGAFRNNLKNTIKNGVEISSNDSANKEFTNAGIQEFRWVSIGDNSVCPDCAGRSGEIGTLEYHETLGLPASGFSVCQGNCRCKLVPIDYKGEDFDKPLIRKEEKKKLGITSFKMAGKHKTAKDSLEWMRSNIADKVQLNQIKDVTILNQITKSLKNNFEKRGLKRIETIKWQRGKAWASANGGGLWINQKIFTKEALQDAYDRSVTNYGKAWREHLDLLKERLKEVQRVDGPEAGSFYKKQIKKAEKVVKTQSKFKRHNALDKNNIAGSIIDHEIGHIIHDQLTGKINGRYWLKNKQVTDEIRNKWNMEWDSIFKKAKREGLISKISEYASKNNRELFAESYAMYVRGEKLPDIIKDYLDRYLTTKDFD